MGTYVYKLSTRKHVQLDGKRVYLATYAYKPYWGWDGDGLNNKMHFRTGCVAADAAFRRKGILPEYWCHTGDDGKPSIEPDDGKVAVFRVARWSESTTTDDNAECIGRFVL